MPGTEEPLFGGVVAVFGRGSDVGLSEAFHDVRETLPLFRVHDEATMGRTAIAFADARRRRQMLICSPSIGRGGVHLLAAAATARTERVPLLVLPADTLDQAHCDPVLNQLEEDVLVAEDPLEPVSTLFVRLKSADALRDTVHEVLRVATDPKRFGPITLVVPQALRDAPAEPIDPVAGETRGAGADVGALVEEIRAAKRPVLLFGTGARDSVLGDSFAAFARATGLPVIVERRARGAIDPADVLGVLGHPECQHRVAGSCQSARGGDRFLQE